MKTSIITLSIFCCTFGSINLKGQQPASNLLAIAVDQRSVSVSPRPDTAALKMGKMDVVINMEMIESFRRCYDKIVPFSLTEFFRGDGNDISAKYMAYMKARMDKEPIENASNTELTNVQASLSEKKNISFANLTYTDKPEVQAAANTGEVDEKTINNPATNKTILTSKRVNGVKWIVPNQK